MMALLQNDLLGTSFLLPQYFMYSTFSAKKMPPIPDSNTKSWSGINRNKMHKHACLSRRVNASVNSSNDHTLPLDMSGTGSCNPFVTEGRQ